MLPAVTNLLALAAPPENPSGSLAGSGEEVAALLHPPAPRLTRIASYGQASPPGFWYDQPEAEWVLLLRGDAVLRFEEGRLPLTAGDSLVIPAHRKHRVERVSQDAIWVALHYPDPGL